MEFGYSPKGTDKNIAFFQIESTESTEMFVCRMFETSKKNDYQQHILNFTTLYLVNAFQLTLC